MHHDNRKKIAVSSNNHSFLGNYNLSHINNKKIKETAEETTAKTSEKIQEGRIEKGGREK